MKPNKPNVFKKLKGFKFSKLSIRWKLLIYFLIFSLIMVLSLWVFQFFILNNVYVEIKKQNVITYGETLKRDLPDNIYTENYLDKMSKIGSENDIYIAVFDITDLENISEYYRISGVTGAYMVHSLSDEQIFECANIARKSKDNSALLYLYLDDNGNIVISDKQVSSIGTSRNINILYSTIAMSSGGMDFMIMLNSIASPVETMIETIFIMLAILTVALIIVALVVSFYASRIIAKPIIKINTAAKNLIGGSYNVEFKGNGYREITELNDTLNYVSIELEKVERLRRELIANVSHDLRTPLTMITGYAEMIRDLPGEDTPENMQVIIDEATRLSSLVKDLIDISVIQNGTTKLTPNKYNLTNSIKTIFKRYSKLIEQNEFKLEFNHDADAYVYADEMKISQVIYNLVNNAINYIGDDKLVIVTQKIKEDTVRIEVSDHGVGIPQDKLDHIWDRYYRVKEHKRAIIGTGLGLSIVKSVLDLHGGKYGVESTLGEGSTFWFEIKTVEPDEAD